MGTFYGRSKCWRRRTRLTKITSGYAFRAVLLPKLKPWTKQKDTYKFMRLGRTFQIENITRNAAIKAMRANVVIQTERGPQPLREHFAGEDATSWRRATLDRERDHMHRWLYKCISCGQLCCSCFGGAPDKRCDNCVTRHGRQSTVNS